MKKLILAAALAVSFPADVHADNGTNMTASPSRPYVGQTVTLTATFVAPCADGVSSSDFLIDGKKYPVQATGAYNYSASLKVSSLRAGTHRIVFQWSTEMYPDLSCGGSDTIILTVLARPSPAPSPQPKPTSTPPAHPSVAPPPSPSAQPSPSESPATSASAARVNVTAGTEPSIPGRQLALLGALLVGALLAIFGLRLARRR